MCSLILPSGSSPHGSDIGRGRIWQGGQSTDNHHLEMIPGMRLRWRLQTGSLHSRSFFKSPYHLEIPTEVLQMEYDVWDLLQNNLRWDEKWWHRRVNLGWVMGTWRFIVWFSFCVYIFGMFHSKSWTLSNCEKVNITCLKLLSLGRSAFNSDSLMESGNLLVNSSLYREKTFSKCKEQLTVPRLWNKVVYAGHFPLEVQNLICA